MKRLFLCFLVGCLWFGQAHVAGAGTVEITEWPVPWSRTQPRDPYVGPDGLVWFVGQRGDYVASLDPDSGKFKRFNLDKGTGPHNLLVDAAGKIWYAGNRAAHIGLLDPAKDGPIKKFPMPRDAARDPHTMAFGPRGNIWFTVQGGNFVGRLAIKSGQVNLLPVPTRWSRPYGIIISPDGTPWFTEFGSHKLGRINTKTMTIDEFPLPRKDARPRRLAATSDGAIWYVDYAQGYLGRLKVSGRKFTERREPGNPKLKPSGAASAQGSLSRSEVVSALFTEWRAPGGPKSKPYGMAVDDKDRLWFVETGPRPNRLVGFDPKSATFFSSTAIASGGGSVRHMVFDKARRLIWFGTDANTIGRARVP